MDFIKGKDKAAAGKMDDFKERLDQLWDIGVPDTLEVIRRNRFYLWPVRKKT